MYLRLNHSDYSVLHFSGRLVSNLIHTKCSSRTLKRIITSVSQKNADHEATTRELICQSDTCEGFLNLFPDKVGFRD